MTARDTKAATISTDIDSLEDDVAFARNGTTSPFGKLDSLVAFRVESNLLDGFSRKAASLDKGVAELLRDLMRISVYGRDEVLKVHRVQIEKVSRMLHGEVSE